MAWSSAFVSQDTVKTGKELFSGKLFLSLARGISSIRRTESTLSTLRRLSFYSCDRLRILEPRRLESRNMVE